MIDLFFRCFSRARWLTLAESRGIITATGNPTDGFAVDELGFITITPAVLDAQGNVVTPAVLDTWWSVNLRVHGAQALGDGDTLYPGEVDTGYKFLKSKLVREFRDQATIVTVRGMRTYQFGATVNRVQIFDPRDVTNPQRVWLGGMSL